MTVQESDVLPHVVSLGQSGVPCFTGTEVPVRNLLDHLAKGYTVYEFLVGFPTVRKQQVLAFLELSASHLMESAFATR